MNSTQTVKHFLMAALSLATVFASPGISQTLGQSAVVERPSIPQVTGAINIASFAEQQNWKLVSKHLTPQSANQLQADATSALHWAVFHQRLAEVKKLLGSGANVNQTNDYQVSPLSIACELGLSDEAKLLIDAGADLESKRLGGETPILLAARNGNPTLVQQLVDAGADVDAKEQGGQTALMWAAAAGNFPAVDVLLHAEADVEHALKKSGFTAFHFAARHGHSDVCKRLLKTGVDVNSVLNPKNSSGRNPRKGMSALLLAIESGHFELALKLVQWGADPNDQRSQFGPLHAVTWVRKTKLGDDPAGDPPPRGSGSVHSLDFVRKMVAHGADVNLQLKEGSARGKAKMNTKLATPFLMAAQTADVPLMNLLLELGADPSLNNADQCTPLIACAGIGAVAVGEEPGTQPEVNAAIELLIERCDQDVNAVDNNKETAMHGAAYRNYPETVRRLTAYGAAPKVWNHKNKFGWTPFDIARGKRPGSVKPSPPTLAALREAIKNQPSTGKSNVN